MRKLASIQRIVSLDPIPDADAIEKATVLGWELVVAKKDNFKVGDLVVYIEVDSIVPDRPEFEFLRERKFRIRTIKLRKQVSQGIAFPLTILPKGSYSEGDDVTELLGVTKYDPQAIKEREEMDRQAQVYRNRFDKFLKRYHWYRRLVYNPARLPFPKFIPRTDEDRIQLFPHIVTTHGHLAFNVTEKLDGQSFTAFVLRNPYKWQLWKRYIFGVCSRNFQIVKENNTSYWEMVRKYNLKERMIEVAKSSSGSWKEGFYVQGEIIGPGIQGNKYSRTENELYLYQTAPVGMDQIRFNYNVLLLIAADLQVPTVPLLDPTCIEGKIIPEIVNEAKGESKLHPTMREGVVYRHWQGKSFKVINPDFLLKEDAKAA